jgi:glycosyltransferase involved in cell wall biosynthesis
MMIGLLAEGMYPYVTGGVAGWIHQLIRSLPEIQFTVIAIIPSTTSPREIRYPKLPNVAQVVDLPLYGQAIDRGGCPHAQAADWKAVARFHDEFKMGEFGGLSKLMPIVDDPRTRSINLHQALYSEASFDLLRQMYRQFAGDAVPFLDYFWTWRGVHIPLFNVIQAQIPPCDLYHSISTGFAGFLGALLRLRTRAPLVVTEHGLYTLERRQELWELMFREREGGPSGDEQSRRLFKRWWGRLFEVMGRLAYHHADWITTPTASNVPRQVEGGAPSDKIEVISGGTDLERVRKIRAGRAPRVEGRLNVGLVGRVVPFKDVKSFLRMGAILLGIRPEARLFILGPTTHDEEYYRQCRDLTTALGLDGRVVFQGETQILDLYRELDVVVLSSIREVQPFVIMEANGAGVPCVATDVGACREMLEGRDGEDRELGPSGLIVPPGKPDQMAHAVLEVGLYPDRWDAMSRAGMARVERSYDQEIGWKRYLEIYRALAPASGPHPAGAGGPPLLESSPAGDPAPGGDPSARQGG